MSIKTTLLPLFGAKYINYPEAYRPTEPKQHNVFICVPRDGTVVTNKLDGRRYIVGVDGAEIVVCGTQGEMWAMPLRQALASYALPCGGSLYEYLKSTFGNRTILFDWLQVKSITVVVRCYALFIPETEKFRFTGADGRVYNVNHLGCPHGSGDFIVCGDIGERPNMADRRVVNGAVFRCTHVMRGKLAIFNDKSVSAVQIPPKSLFTVAIAVHNGAAPPERKAEVRTSAGDKDEFYLITLAVCESLHKHGIKYSLKLVPMLNDTRFTFQCNKRDTQSVATVMLDTATWSYVIHFDTRGGYRHFIRGRIEVREVSAAAHILGEIIIKSRGWQF